MLSHTQGLSNAIHSTCKIWNHINLSPCTTPPQTSTIVNKNADIKVLALGQLVDFFSLPRRMTVLGEHSAGKERYQQQ